MPRRPKMDRPDNKVGVDWWGLSCQLGSDT